MFCVLFCWVVRWKKVVVEYDFQELSRSVAAATSAQRAL